MTSQNSRVAPKHAHTYKTDYAHNMMQSESAYVFQNSLATVEMQEVSEVAVMVRASTKHGGRALYLNLLLIIIHNNI